MIVYRLSKTKYANDLSGQGTELSGGRWNSKGIAMIYITQSRALCTTEVAVHTPLGNIPFDYRLITFDIPDQSISYLSVAQTPSDWKSFPHPDSTQTKGDRFIIEAKYLTLKVPSVVVPGAFNHLLNPGHQLFHEVKILGVELFEFD
jgi:RES domain-containing protein